MMMKSTTNVVTVVRDFETTADCSRPLVVLHAVDRCSDRQFYWTRNTIDSKHCDVASYQRADVDRNCQQTSKPLSGHVTPSAVLSSVPSTSGGLVRVPGLHVQAGASPRASRGHPSTFTWSPRFILRWDGPSSPGGGGFIPWRRVCRAARRVSGGNGILGAEGIAGAGPTLPNTPLWPKPLLDVRPTLARVGQSAGCASLCCQVLSLSIFTPPPFPLPSTPSLFLSISLSSLPTSTLSPFSPCPFFPLSFFSLPPSLSTFLSISSSTG